VAHWLSFDGAMTEPTSELWWKLCQQPEDNMQFWNIRCAVLIQWIDSALDPRISRICHMEPFPSIPILPTPISLLWLDSRWISRPYLSVYTFHKSHRRSRYFLWPQGCFGRIHAAQILNIVHSVLPWQIPQLQIIEILVRVSVASDLLGLLSH
jgi:hypothetical protein